MMVVVVFCVPATTNCWLESCGATAAMPGRPRSALPSARVRVVAEPNAPRVPPLNELPALIVRRFVPEALEAAT